MDHGTVIVGPHEVGFEPSFKPFKGSIGDGKDEYFPGPAVTELHHPVIDLAADLDLQSFRGDPVRRDHLLGECSDCYFVSFDCFKKRGHRSIGREKDLLKVERVPTSFFMRSKSPAIDASSDVRSTIFRTQYKWFAEQDSWGDDPE